MSAGVIRITTEGMLPIGKKANTPIAPETENLCAGTDRFALNFRRIH